MKIAAPGKLILSGEHAVVYGHPALAMAVNRYAIATARPQTLPIISFDLSDLAYEDGLTFTALRHLKNRIKRKYQRFMRGDFSIREVLHKPVELAQIALMLFLETLNFKLTHGIKIHLKSDIPIGCGMGSSAATVLSIVHAIGHHFQMDLSSDIFFRLALEAEKMQHGKSSGLDLRVSLQGGCIYFKNQEVHSRTLPDMPFYLINTGSPDTSTGECVTQAAAHFKTGSTGDDFAAVTEAMDTALQQNKKTAVMDAIRANHQLLTRIGVVPDDVKQFIHEAEQLSAAAKICGAGAVSGHKAGMVLLMTDDAEMLQTLCARYHYTMFPVTGESRGVHVI
jgi:mevalonate kinase